MDTQITQQKKIRKPFKKSQSKTYKNLGKYIHCEWQIDYRYLSLIFSDFKFIYHLKKDTKNELRIRIKYVTRIVEKLKQ